MKRTLLIVFCIVTFYNVEAQKQELTQKIRGESQVDIALDETKRIFTPPPTEVSKLKSGTTSGNFNVTYENFPEDAKIAFQYAVNIWESFISSPVQINIIAKWESLDANVLALGKPAQFYKNFNGANISDVYYPVALAEKLASKELNGSEPDIICSFNNNISWYLGTDGNTPSSKYDFTTAVLHEITHGLGFSGFFNVEDGNGLINNPGNLPSIYDYSLFNKGNQRISDNENFSSPSQELFQQFTCDNLEFKISQENQNINSNTPLVYAPTSWKSGISLYHLDHNDFETNDANSLMSAYKYKGEAVHCPGDMILEMLSEMGWKTISFNFDVIKDFEETCENLPIQIGINCETPLDSNSVKVVFSKDYFTTKDSMALTYDFSKNLFVGNLPVNNHLGNLQYYFIACNSAKKTYSLPSNAPAKKLSFRVGPDYSPPSVQHNPIKLISNTTKKMKLTAIADDNMGIKSVVVEYKLDGVAQKPFNLTIDSDDFFSGNIEIPEQFKGQDKIEYRIVADDNSKNGNTVTLPSKNEYYSVNIFETLAPVNSYKTDFNSNVNDFISADFEVSQISGFSNGILHTQHPYPVSALENEKYNLITQLKIPVILEESGIMSFNEVVLVEPGEVEADYNDLLFWDYVIVEGSNNKGETWLPLTTGYDSNLENEWYSTFVSSLNGNTSTKSGNENMLVEREINLTNNTGFNAGDTVIFRFRLSSDKSVNGWGWAIDDLQIQSGLFETEELIAEESINVYPNPFAGSFFVDCSNANQVSTVDILVTDLMGKTVFRENWTNPQFDTKKQINLNDIKPGIYLVNMVTDASEIITKKIVKY